MKLFMQFTYEKLKAVTTKKVLKNLHIRSRPHSTTCFSRVNSMVSEHCETKLEITMPALVQNPEIFENETKQIQIPLGKIKLQSTFMNMLK
jgi:hypothetical protein